jgi:carbonic anhydrase
MTGDLRTLWSLEMKRRDFVRLLSAGALVSCPLCSAALASETPKNAAAADGAVPPAIQTPGHGDGHWSYEGAGAPEHWGDLSPEFRACGAGTQQSPLNLDNRMPSLLNGLTIDWRPGPCEVVNNGHTIQANTTPDSRLELEGKHYDLLQFHFHHPSEHQVDGRPYSMEVHFVHKSAEGNLAVLGVFLTPGREHGELQKIWARMPRQAGQKVAAPAPLDLRLMLPANRACYRYAGSLTTPPCSEVVDWLVFRDPIEVSAGQIAQFARLYPANARPVQPQHRRFILGNF